MPLICLCISYPVSVSLSDAADSILRLALALAIADCSNKIPGHATLLVIERVGQRLSNSLSFNRLSLGFRVQLCTYRKIPVLARDCELGHRANFSYKELLLVKYRGPSTKFSRQARQFDPALLNVKLLGFWSRRLSVIQSLLVSQRNLAFSLPQKNS